MEKYLLNPYYLGDSVMLEPIARLTGRTLVCDTPELFDNHPTVKAQKECPESQQVLDMGGVLGGYDLKRLYDFVGVTEEPFASCLYLSKEESRQVDGIKRSFKGKRIGVLLSSRHQVKSYPYTHLLVAALRKRGVSVFSFDSTRQIKSTTNITDAPIRDIMVWLSAMDLVIGPDTGTAHIAAALGIPVIVIGVNTCKELYDVYENVRCLTHPISPALISVRRVLKAAKLDSPPARSRLKIGLMRLDGLGGTVTLSDHIAKIARKYPGVHITLIIRKHQELFHLDPHVDDVIEVGIGLQQGTVESLDFAKDKGFDSFADIRFAPAKWYGEFNGIPHYEQAYETFPIGRSELVQVADKHHTLITDLDLSLSDEKIETRVYFDASQMIDGEYIVIAGGVDTNHKGLIQTKNWHGWQALVKLLRPQKVVQVGTRYDIPTPGAVDLRGKTTVYEVLSVLKYAKHIVTIEGGIMHLAAALGHKSVFVLSGPTASRLFLYPYHTHLKSFVCTPCVFRTDNWDRVCPEGIDAVCMKSISPERVAYAVLA